MRRLAQEQLRGSFVEDQHRRPAQRNTVEDQAIADQAKARNEQNKQGKSYTLSELKDLWAVTRRAVESQKSKVPNVTAEDQIDRHQLWDLFNGNNSSKARYTLKIQMRRGEDKHTERHIVRYIKHTQRERSIRRSDQRSVIVNVDF
ncbi:non-lysosomal glucosylceramidase-like [Dorcoceras hygrometricum]|uniref:Non-lysosomal glucosylceramidase-like n=1 Tax=Dorcoceras hygrometricum TaxID=472368 RepID=A0A2Z7BDD2_9LAMI|nr:non-lysosomal glucosylceramidase-like [Dorcoceras hygrometricum]